MKLFVDHDSGLEWSLISEEMRDFGAASEHAEDTLLDTTWRIPTLAEFETILDRTKIEPTFKDGIDGPIGLYWTSDAFAKHPENYYWAVDTTYGTVLPKNIQNRFWVIHCREIT